MTSVFIGGSREIRQLSPAVITRIDNIIANNHQVLIGDANGVDTLVQTYLAERSYPNVAVFCTGNTCRNNVGGWESRSVSPRGRQGGFAFYALKDLQMAQEADCGFMLWDTRSNGTLNNLLNLLERDKKSLVWLLTEDAFFTTRKVQDLSVLLSKCTARDLGKFEAKLNLSERLTNMQPELAFA